MLSRHVRAAALMLTCLIVGCAVGDTPVKPNSPATEPVDPMAVETVWYDVHDLTTYVPKDPTEKADELAQDNATNWLVNLIRTQVETQSWQDNGGQLGKIDSYMGTFIVTQTPAAHSQIKALLARLRQQHDRSEPTVILDAYWVRLAPAQLPTGESTIAASLLADPTVVYARARAMGFENQSVTTSVTRTVGVVSSVTPVVAPGAVAYEPTIESKQSDATLIATPCHIHDGSLDVTFDSTVTMRPGSVSTGPATRPSTEPVNAMGPLVFNAANEVVGSTVAVIHSRSAVRMKIGVPTVVSGMSDHPGAGDNRTLCLVLCATVEQEK